LSKTDIQYLFDYVRDLQKQVNQLKVAVLTGKINGLEFPNPIHLDPGEKIPLGHLADDLLDTEFQNRRNDTCNKSNE
jgi:hypothetical protein